MATDVRDGEATVICTRNRLQPLINCLQSLAEQTYPISQLIIVDSSDSPVQAAPAFADMYDSSRFPDADLV